MSKIIEHKHYVRTQKTDDDKNQIRFTNTGEIETPKPIKETNINPNKIMYCPFCLAKGKLRRFLISDSKGISIYKVKCFECKTEMFMRTLLFMTDMNSSKIEAYGKWVADYSRQGYWGKNKWEIWTQRLKKYDWEIEFWLAYKKYRVVVPRDEKY
jgi:hypothetical protein